MIKYEAITLLNKIRIGAPLDSKDMNTDIIRFCFKNDLLSDSRSLTRRGKFLLRLIAKSQEIAYHESCYNLMLSADSFDEPYDHALVDCVSYLCKVVNFPSNIFSEFEATRLRIWFPSTHRMMTYALVEEEKLL